LEGGLYAGVLAIHSIGPSPLEGEGQGLSPEKSWGKGVFGAF